MNYEEFKNNVILECGQLGIKEYEIYYTLCEETSIDVFGHEVNGFSSSEHGGVCFRCIHNGKMGYSSTESLSEDSAKEVVSKALDNASVLESDEEVFLAEGGQCYEKLPEISYNLPTTSEMIDVALDTQEKLYNSNKLVIDGTQTQVIRERYETAIYNSKGLNLHQSSQDSGLVVSAVVSNNEEMADSYEIKLGNLANMDIDSIVAKCSEDAVRKLGGDVAPTGQYPVLFTPEAMSALLQTFCEIFSSENAQKGLSKLNGMEGEMIASKCVTIVDDPMHDENPAPKAFDDEGCPTRKKNIVENGKLNTLLYNMKTAAVAKRKTTGNAAKSSFTSPVGILPFSMYIANGDCSEEELIENVGNGIIINSLGGLHAGANAISGDFSLQSSGFMIKDGKKDNYVKSFTVAGNFYQLLKGIRMVANNCKLPHAFSSTAFGSPSVIVDGLSIAGK